MILSDYHMTDLAIAEQLSSKSYQEESKQETQNTQNYK